MDEHAAHRYGPIRLRPAQMAAVVTALDRLGAQVIAFDFVFSGEAEQGCSQPHRRARQEPLRDATARGSQLVLGIYFDFETESEDRAALLETHFGERRMSHDQRSRVRLCHRNRRTFAQIRSQKSA